MDLYKLNHHFEHNKDPRNYIYDSIENKKAPNQVTKNIINSSHLVASNPTIQVKPLCGVFNQGDLGSCAPTALAVAISVASNGTINDACRLYTYFITQSLQGTNPLKDNGSSTQAIIQSLKSYSCCPEKYFPYLSSNYLKIPPLPCFQNTYSLKKVIYSYIAQDANMWANIQNSILNVIHQVKGGFTGLTLGFRVYSSFMTAQVAKNGIVPMPNPSKERSLGGHCVALVGYVTLPTGNYVVFQNSWGTGWGNGGFGYFPIQYLQNPSLSEKPLVFSLGY